MKLKKADYLLALFCCIFLQTGYSQNNINKDKFRLSVQEAIDPILLDGKLDEKSWKEAPQTKEFLNKWPTDEGLPPLQTYVSLIYDNDFLYVGALCKENPGDLVIQTLKRDNTIWSSDGFAVVLDPVNQQTNGFIFYTNALGVQTEGQVSPLSDNEEGMSRDWDNRWFVETHRNAEGDWTVEMAIPFKTLRYSTDLKEWGINFLRCDLGNNAYSTWAHIPIQFEGTDLAYSGTLDWDKAPPQTKSNISVIPYITGGVVKEEDEETTGDFDAGLDAKVALSSSLNLDLTVNPDFSQIEVDVQQTNLTRFSLFFPERRTFFLENSDIFSDFGIPPIRPFFSRRIGLDDDGNAIPILMGARLSGNLNEGLRVGLMTMQTRSTDTELAQNYSVGVLQQRVFKRSSFKLLGINRQAFYEGDAVKSDFGRNLGGEFNYFTPSGNIGAWAGYHASFKPEKYDENGFVNFGVMYNSKNFSTVQNYSRIGDNFIADAGFVLRLDNYDAERDTTIRLGQQLLFQQFGYSIFPKAEKPKVNFHRLQLESFNTFYADGGAHNYRSTQFSYTAFLANTSFVSASINTVSEDLPFPSNFVDEDFDNIPAGWYHYNFGNMMYWSNRRKLFSYNLMGSYGQFYNGTLTQVGGSLRYRIQPWGAFELNFERNILRFPENYGTTKLWLIGPRIEINFSKDMFWTTFIQYNTQADNFNINSRFQWRYAPMSDLFLVYTDNYTVENFGLKSRALVLKFNYWLTL